MNKYAKTELKSFVGCTYALYYVTYQCSAQFLNFCMPGPARFKYIIIYLEWAGQGKLSNFTSVIETKSHRVGPGRDFLRQIFKLFCTKKYAKTAITLFAAMTNRRLSTNFHLNIFIFVAMARAFELYFSHRSKMTDSRPG